MQAEAFLLTIHDGTGSVMMTCTMQGALQNIQMLLELGQRAMVWFSNAQPLLFRGSEGGLRSAYKA